MTGRPGGPSPSRERGDSEASHRIEAHRVAASHRIVLAVVIVVQVASLATLGATGLMDPDEPRYAGAAREMRETGDYLIPRFNDEIRLVKPILPYWFIALASQVFGMSELAARLPSAIAGIVTMLATAFLARDMLGSRSAAVDAAAAISLSPLLLVVSRLATPDAALGACIAVAMALFARAASATDAGAVGAAGAAGAPGPRPFGPAWICGFWGALAAGFLVKGPVAIILPGLAVTTLLLLRRDDRALRRLRPALGIPLFLVLALPWYVAVGLDRDAGGAAVFASETVGRYLGAQDYHSRPFAYFLPVLLAGFFPWSMLAIEGGVHLLRTQPRGRGTLAIVWIASTVLFFSVSPNKQPAYLVPIGPAIACLAAAGIEARRRSPGQARSAVIGVAEGLLLASAGVALSVFLWRSFPDVLARGLLPSAALAAGGLVVAAASMRNNPLLASSARSLALGLAIVPALFVLVPAVEKERSYRALAPLLAPVLRPDDLLVQGWFDQPGLVYYAHHTVVRLDRVEDIVTNMAAPRPMYCLLEEENFELVSRSLARPPRILLRQWGKVLFTNVEDAASGNG